LVIDRYATLIKDLISNGRINPDIDNIFKAIAWTTSKPDDRDGIIKLNHYHPGFSKEHVKLIINYPCLESYLHYYDTGTNKIASIRKSILNAVLRVLRLEKIDNPVNQRTFTKRSLEEYIKQEQIPFYPEFKLAIYNICAENADGKTEDALKLLVQLVKDVLQKFGKTISGAKSFVIKKHVTIVTATEDSAKAKRHNQFQKDGITIDITTVHAVKGQTHTCTLYMESFYQKNLGGKGQYESSRIADQLQGIPVPATAHEFVKQSLKMSYVGFSRPTHFLCFAVLKSRFDTHYAGKPNISNWRVEEVKIEPIETEL
jgi:DNA helicase-2/ATP-dependent DNA helicase PcrA